MLDPTPKGKKEPKSPVNGNGKSTGNTGLSTSGLSSATGKSLALADRENLVYQTQSDAPPCPECGTIMTRSGSCYRCINCGGS